MLFFNLKDKTDVFIGRKSSITAMTSIGDGTRINGKIIVKGKGKCVIKKYCAVGDNVRIITSNHKTNQINLQYALQRKLGFNSQVDKKINVEIGNNVWIGDSVLILPGVVIGNGAVIAAGSVVTKNVSAYSIVGGIPSKLIKYRFNESTIDNIDNTEWWNWSFEKMKENKEFFQDEI
jgi:virginiamycin A acetyltransferase